MFLCRLGSITLETEKQLRNNNVYGEINYDKNILFYLVDTYNIYFKKLYSRDYIGLDTVIRK